MAQSRCSVFVCDLAGTGPLCQPAKAGHMRSLPGQLPQTQHNMAQCSPSWQIMRPKTEKMSNIEISHNIIYIYIYIFIYENDFAKSLRTWFLCEAMTAAG